MMFCSKCGKELSDENFCPNCGAKITKEKERGNVEHTEILSNAKNVTGSYVAMLKENVHYMKVNKPMYFSLLILMVLEWILVTAPVVEVGSDFLNQTLSYTFFDLQDSNFLKLMITILHLASIVVQAIPLVRKREIKGRYFVPALATSLIVSIMYIRLTLVMDDSLLLDIEMGEILQYVVDASLTTSSICLIIVSAIAFLVSLIMALSAGPEEITAKENTAE